MLATRPWGHLAEASAHFEVMASLRQQLDGITQVIPRGAAVAYLDIPVHFNVGDLLINLGTEAFFAAHDIRVIWRASLFDLCKLDWSDTRNQSLQPHAQARLEALPANTIIVLHGGGNFGDLYPEFQRMRELLVAACPARRIVVMPQSMHFKSPQAQERSLALLAAHPDLHVFFRDQPSQQAASAWLRHARLMPDMAHALWATESEHVSGGQSGGRLYLARRDDEMSEVRPREWGRHADWSDLVRREDVWQFRMIRKTMTRHWDPTGLLAMWAWERVRDRLVRRAVRTYRAHESVVTDRLHGMLLGALLDMPVQYMDNSYGKLSRYASLWLHGSDRIRPMHASQQGGGGV